MGVPPVTLPQNVQIFNSKLSVLQVAIRIGVCALLAYAIITQDLLLVTEIPQGDTKARLLDAVVQIFSEQGFHATSMRAVTQLKSKFWALKTPKPIFFEISFFQNRKIPGPQIRENRAL